MARILIAEDEALLAVEIREELMRLWPEAEVLPLAHDDARLRAGRGQRRRGLGGDRFVGRGAPEQRPQRAGERVLRAVRGEA